MDESATIGIVGGGQLGRMLTLAALPLGFKVIVLNPTPNSPAAQVGAEEIVADLYDPIAIKQLADRSDYLTVEIEHLDADALELLVSTGKQVNPAPQTIKLIQDKLLQKEKLAKAGIPVAPFMPIDSVESAQEALKKFSGKMLIKARHGSYDGRGNFLVKSQADIVKAFKLFKDRELYAEKFIPFQKELAVMLAKSIDGKVVLYPIVETIHARNICLEVLAPASINAKQSRAAQKAALKVAEVLKGAGVFGIEMFLCEDELVLVNEIAPRVHNSGHYTIEANRTSQFEQHIRAITNLPLGDTSMVVPASVMINILGERNGPTKLGGLNKALAIPNVSLHIYGKSPTKVDRKMGHITATGQSLNIARKRAIQARKQISI